jgi:hypothetical protein
MSEMQKAPREWAKSLVFPLVLFVASRCFLVAFALAAPLFGPHVGADPALAPAFRAAHPLWATLAHGEIANYARVARNGYVSLADASTFPLLPWASKGLGGGAVEVALLLLSTVLCGFAFVGLYRVCEALRDAETARWAVGLLAAFPLAYHLSDGSALGALVAFSTWGVLLALRGHRLASGLVLALGVLAHPACACAAVATAWPPRAAGAQPADRGGGSRLFALLPLVVLVGCLWFIAAKVKATPATLWSAWWPAPGKMLGKDWRAMMEGFGAALAVGLLLLARQRSLRVLAAVGAAQLVLALVPQEPTAASAMAACWPAFLAGGYVLARHRVVRGPLLGMLAIHQGLLLYCYTHFLRRA